MKNIFKNLTHSACYFYVLSCFPPEAVGCGLQKSPLFFSNLYLYYIQKGNLNILHCIILHVACKGYFLNKNKWSVSSVTFLGKQGWILRKIFKSWKTLKGITLNYIISLCTCKRSRSAKIPSTWMVEICWIHLKIENVIDFNKGVFCCHTFLLIYIISH